METQVWLIWEAYILRLAVWALISLPRLWHHVLTSSSLSSFPANVAEDGATQRFGTVLASVWPLSLRCHDIFARWSPRYSTWRCCLYIHVMRYITCNIFPFPLYAFVCSQWMDEPDPRWVCCFLIRSGPLVSHERTCMWQQKDENMHIS